MFASLSMNRTADDADWIDEHRLVAALRLQWLKNKGRKARRCTKEEKVLFASLAREAKR